MKIACVQMTTACDPSANLKLIEAQVQEAAKAGADIVALPETCTFMEKNRAAMQARLETQGDSQVLAMLQNIAKANGVTLLVGSLILADEDSDKAVNRSVLIAADGQLRRNMTKSICLMSNWRMASVTMKAPPIKPVRPL